MIDNSAIITRLGKYGLDAAAWPVTIEVEGGRPRRYARIDNAIRALSRGTYQATDATVYRARGDAAAVTAPESSSDPREQANAIRAAIDHLVTELEANQDAELEALKDADEATGMVLTLDWVQEARKGLKVLEDRITWFAGRAFIKRLGTLPDGRTYEVKRSANRTKWVHDDWKDAARKALTAKLEIGDELVNPESGETISAYQLMRDLQEFHGAAAPRTGTLRKYGIDPDDYCHSEPGGWSVRIIDAPTD